ncbi:hypothetical protein LCGC14_1798720, partial [marine sediment metagenome]
VSQQAIAVQGQADPVLMDIARRMAEEGRTTEEIIKTLDLGEGGQRGFLPLGPLSEEVSPKIEEATAGAEQVLRGAGTVGRTTVESFGVIPEAAFKVSREVFQGDLAGAAAEAKAAGGATIENIQQAWDGVEDIFEGEQRIFTPFTRPLINETLLAFGVPEDIAGTVAKYAAEFAVPTTFLAGGALLGKGKKLWQIARTLLGEGVVNMLQDRAARVVRGEAPQTKAEALFIFTAGMGGRGALELAGVAGGKLVRKFLNGEPPIAVRPDAEITPTAQGAPLETAGVRRIQTGDEVALVSDPSTPVGRIIAQSDQGVTIRPDGGGKPFLRSRERVQAVESEETFFRGIAGDEGDELFEGADLIPNRKQAQVFADTAARETGGTPRVVEVRARRSAVEPHDPVASPLTASQGAVTIRDITGVRVVEPGAAPARGAGTASLSEVRTGQPFTARLYRGETSDLRPRERGTFLTPDRQTASGFAVDEPSVPLTRVEQRKLTSLTKKESTRRLAGHGGLSGSEDNLLLELKLRGSPVSPTTAGARVSFGEESFSNPIVFGSKKDTGSLLPESVEIVRRDAGEVGLDEMLASAARDRGHDAIVYTRGESGAGVVVDLRLGRAAPASVEPPPRAALSKAGTTEFKAQSAVAKARLQAIMDDPRTSTSVRRNAKKHFDKVCA